MNIVNFPAIIAKLGFLEGKEIDINTDLLIIGKKVNNLRDGTEFLEEVCTIKEFINIVNDNLPKKYKVYSALISQTGSSAPSVIELENSLDAGSIVWTRNSTGNYTGTLTGSFPIDKSFFYQPQQPNNSGDVDHINMGRDDDNRVFIETYTSGSTSDDVLNYTSIEIKVYN